MTIIFLLCFQSKGTTSGTILLFDIPIKGNGVTLVNEIMEKAVKSSIVALASDLDGNYLAGCDTSGNILFWTVKSTKNFKLSFAIRPKKM